jgi:hypothetical protein
MPALQINSGVYSLRRRVRTAGIEDKHGGVNRFGGTTAGIEDRFGARLKRLFEKAL